MAARPASTLLRPLADPVGAAPTEVCITVDTEFSIGGAFADPERYRPLSAELVDCMIDGRGRGLDFLLRALNEFRIPATFFVEALQCFYFGERPMGQVARRIADQGHDLQLHLHPCWLGFRNENWRGSTAEGDTCATRSCEEMTEMIEFGIAQFSRWQLARPQALRTGSFSCGPVIHQAMAASGVTLGANIALAAYRSRDPEFHVPSGTRMFAGVLEVAAFTYSAPYFPTGSRLRTLAITSTSWREMEALLWLARQAGISPILVLTHPFEFVKRRDFRFREMRCDNVNQDRLRRLLEFLNEHNDAFSTTTFARSGGAWAAAGSRPGGLLQAPVSLALTRLGENAVNTLLWNY